MAVYVEHAELGRVAVAVRPTARRFVARMGSDGVVRLSVPPNASEADVRRALDSMAPRLLARKPAGPLYSDGMVLELTGMRVEIRCTAAARGRIYTSGTTSDVIVNIDPSLPLGRPDVAAAVSRLLLRVAKARAPQVLLPQAAAVAAEVGVAPRRWSVGSGLRTLGRCTAAREISLSAALMFVPDHLRRYVVCHELAHLTEMNHSERFHRLCDSYCGGREAALAAELKAYRWPILR